MKNLFLPFLLLFGLCTACNGSRTVTNGDLRLEIDSRMHWRVSSLAEGALPVSRDFAPAGALIADEGVFTDFELTRTERIGGGDFALGRLRA